MAKIYIVTAEHFSVPGVSTTAHTTRDSAVAKAVELTNLIRKDHYAIWDLQFDEVTADDWEEGLADPQEEHGEAHCYVEVLDRELFGAPPSPDEIMTKIRDAVGAARKIDDTLNDPHGDGSSRGAQAPSGDSYNELWDAICPLIALVEG